MITHWYPAGEHWRLLLAQVIKFRNRNLLDVCSDIDGNGDRYYEIRTGGDRW